MTAENLVIEPSEIQAPTTDEALVVAAVEAVGIADFLEATEAELAGHRAQLDQLAADPDRLEAGGISWGRRARWTAACVVDLGRRLSYARNVAAGTLPLWDEAPEDDGREVDSLVLEAFARFADPRSLAKVVQAAVGQLRVDHELRKTVDVRVKRQLTVGVLGTAQTPSGLPSHRTHVEHQVRADFARLEVLNTRRTRLQSALRGFPAALGKNVRTLLESFPAGVLARSLTLATGSAELAGDDAHLGGLRSELEAARTRHASLVRLLEVTGASAEEIAASRAEVFGDLEARVAAREAEIQSSAESIYARSRDMVNSAIKCDDIDQIISIYDSASSAPERFPAGFAEQLRNAVQLAVREAGQAGFAHVVSPVPVLLNDPS